MRELLPIFLFHLFLTALPAAAGIAYLVRQGVRSLPILLAAALLASGAVGLAAFWIYYGSPDLGKSFSVAVFLGSCAVLLWSVKNGKGIDRPLLRELAIPFGLWACGSAFVLFLGFAHEGFSAPLAAASSRFSHPLPGDNILPYFYSAWFYVHGHVGTPPTFTGGWLVSDRPPLQIGYALAQRPGEWGNPELHYQVLGVLLQQFWILGLWALLRAGGIERTTRLLTMLTVLVSGTVLVNGFFVWPKLLPAAMLLAVIALLATPEWFRVRKSRRGAALIAGLLALALMGHGASTFMVIPLVALLLLRGIPNWKWAAVGVAVAIALLAPWSAFQKYADPPGNRVVKWMLAGQSEIDGRGTLQAIGDDYREVGLEGAFDNKMSNFETMTGGHQAFEELKAGFSADLESAVRTVRIDSFFFLVPDLGWLLIVPALMLVARLRGRYRVPEWRLSLRCLTLVLAGCLVWGLMLFGGPESRAVVHQGSLVVPLLAVAGLILGLRASFPRIAVAFVGVNALLSLAVYAPALDPLEGTSYSATACLLAALSLCGFLVLASREDDVSRAPSSLKGSAVAVAATQDTIPSPAAL